MAVIFVTVMKAQEAIPVHIVELAELTLSENPIIQRNQQTINNAAGSYRIQKGFFDYHIFSSVSINRNYLDLYEMDPRRPLTEGNLNTRGMMYSMGLMKRFRSGLSANWSVNYSSVNDNFSLNRFNEDVGPNINDHVVSSSLSLAQPLMRGRGKSFATALEQSSALNLQSARKNVAFANSVELFELAVSYWQYVAAYKSATIYQENEARVRRVLEITQQLVDGDKKPRGDLAQVQADLANQERQSNVAQQNLISARLNLGRAIGLSESESHQIGEPMDDFPTIEESLFIEGMDVSSLKTLAHTNRKDIEANSITKRALELQLLLARNDRKPQLDLLGTMNYGGMGMGNAWNDALAPFTHSDGRDVGFELGLRFEFPINNNQAQGAYLQSKALLKDQEIANNNLVRNIDLDVAIAVNNIEYAVAVLKNARESLSYYQEVYENEQAKFHNGLTTLLNLILFQERLTFAQLDYLQARQQFAIAIVNLRYETGTLLSTETKEAGPPLLSSNLFYTIPKP